MKIIFLDFDGVLKRMASLHRYMPLDKKLTKEEIWALCDAAREALKKTSDSFLDPEPVALLSELVQRSNARIVVSSSLRIFNTLQGLRDVLHEAGYPAQCPIIGKTLRGGACYRGDEIQAWLDAAARRRWHIESFCILDDGDDMVHLTPRLVQTNASEGLQQHDVERAVEMLNTTSTG